MKKIDYHMHTSFSADSDAFPREHVLQAIKMGLDEICFTDHQDFNYPYYSFNLDDNTYFNEISLLKEEFKDDIHIKIGLEIGLDLDYKNEIEAFVNKYPYDFVIGSIHVIHKTEFYDPAEFFENKEKRKAHKDFFENTLECIREFDCFNVLGHLDYIYRYGPYKDKAIDYKENQSLIDEILKTLIEKNKGIEVNTSGYKNSEIHGFPKYDIVEKYYRLGGRIITIGTDSHTSDRVGEHVEDVIKNLKKIGFNEITTFHQRHPDLTVL